MLSILEQVHDIIQSFHLEKQSLSCLNLDSFKFETPFSKTLRLVDFKIYENSSLDSLGFAHTEESYEADW